MDKPFCVKISRRLVNIREKFGIKIARLYIPSDVLVKPRNVRFQHEPVANRMAVDFLPDVFKDSDFTVPFLVQFCRLVFRTLVSFPVENGNFKIPYDKLRLVPAFKRKQTVAADDVNEFPVFFSSTGRLSDE